nr:MAG TPA: hypothetical protein [Caudoviricetes sp.]
MLFSSFIPLMNLRVPPLVRIFALPPRGSP